MTRAIRSVVVLAAFVAWGVPVLSSGWSPALAAKYLDERQEKWFAWKTAASPDGPCVSCHTGMSYLLARPALRQALGQSEPTRYERGLMDRLRSNVGAKPAGALQGVEVVFAALFLAQQDGGRAMSPDTQRAFDQLWQLQQTEGSDRGGWPWYTFANLNPYEHSGSTAFGAALGAIAIASTSAQYRDTAAARTGTLALTKYLGSVARAAPLHDRLSVLWASSTMPALMSGEARASLIADTLARQGADGGWSNESLGPWSAHADAPPSPGSSSFATAFTAFVLGKSGVTPTDARLARALDWLAAHQDRDTGAWPASSMNKRYRADSMEIMFLQDAATSFASLALLEAKRE